MNDVEDFVRQSAGRERNRKIGIFAAVLLAMIVLSGLTVWAIGEFWRAEEQARIAEEQRARADERTRPAEIEEGKAWIERANYYKWQPGKRIQFPSGTADYESAF